MYCTVDITVRSGRWMYMYFTVDNTGRPGRYNCTLL